jgi:hypothetical protein
MLSDADWPARTAWLSTVAMALPEKGFLRRALAERNAPNHNSTSIWLVVKPETLDLHRFCPGLLGGPSHGGASRLLSLAPLDPGQFNPKRRPDAAAIGSSIVRRVPCGAVTAALQMLQNA